jgi:regulator of cell morphogenesis and NO signaling
VISQDTSPEDVNGIYKDSLSLLKEFEINLHKHLHLENNILFPKALKLEKELTA